MSSDARRRPRLLLGPPPRAAHQHAAAGRTEALLGVMASREDWAVLRNVECEGGLVEKLCVKWWSYA